MSAITHARRNDDRLVRHTTARRCAACEIIQRGYFCARYGWEKERETPLYVAREFILDITPLAEFARLSRETKWDLNRKSCITNSARPRFNCLKREHLRELARERRFLNPLFSLMNSVFPDTAESEVKVSQDADTKKKYNSPIPRLCIREIIIYKFIRRINGSTLSWLLLSVVRNSDNLFKADLIFETWHFTRSNI